MRHFARVMPALTCALAVAAVAPALLAQAQLRPGQPSVLAPPPPPLAAPTPDFVAEFRTRYFAAGSPRIMLYWNTELSDRDRQDVVLRDHDTITVSKSDTMLQQGTTGDAGVSTLTQDSAQSQAQRTRELSVGTREDPKRVTTLSPRNFAQFEHAFEAQLRQAGTHVVDRAMAVRITAVEKANAGDNPQKLEAEAVRGKAELLLQVLFISDDKAPLGYGFDASVRDVKTGAVLASFYTLAAPPPPPIHTRYVATDRGFVRQTIPTRVTTLEDVASELAHDVMNQLGPALPARAGNH